MRRWMGLVLGIAACNGGDGGRADTILSLTGDETAGEALYADSCAVCHAADGSGGSGPDLSGESVGGEVVGIILHGEDDMPGFADDFSDQDVADLLAWLDANVFE